MNKDEYILEAKDENINFPLIKAAINNIFNDKVKNKELFHRNSDLTGTKIEKQFIQIFIF